jgi:hypothetical protein
LNSLVRPVPHIIRGKEDCQASRGVPEKATTAARAANRNRGRRPTPR